jgi:hypothetical protein
MRSFSAVVAVAVLLTSVSASATTLIYNDFSDVSGLTVNGNAAVATDGGGRKVLRVTPSLQGQAGSSFSTSSITLGADVSFSTRFTFNFNNQLNDGADGLVFVVQTNSNSVGGSGGGIGYYQIPNSVGIEFDNWFNGEFPANDPDGNHVGIDLAGSIISSPAVTSPYLLDSGKDLTAWVDYNGATQLLEVRLSDTVSRPSAALLSSTVDLVDILGTPNAFVGFTSGTGYAAANHDVISWEFRDQYDPIPGDPVRGVPEPANWAMMIAGFGMVGTAIRRRRTVQPRLI